ncbi:hypothetical protein HAX54_043314 [Datura stramonium]|uniref:Uncharacterized protein n=1 Tax=Datura stramonium TaxID=4076 RepID=A0ABS8W3J8_DATST|nr:hypothetical protein [Datura stramonium]
MAEEAPPSTQGELPSTLSMIVKVLSQNLPIHSCPLPRVRECKMVDLYTNLKEVKNEKVDLRANGVSLTLTKWLIGSKEKGPVTQMIFDLHTATARVVELKRENAQLKTDLYTANVEICTLKDRMLSEQSVHNNRIDKLLSLIGKTTHSSS